MLYRNIQLRMNDGFKTVFLKSEIATRLSGFVGKNTNKENRDMALSYLIRTQNDSIKELDASCFTKQNYVVGYDNATITAYTPNGVLGGSVAAVSAASGDYKVVPADGTALTIPVGLFVNDAAGRSWESNQALASNKITIAKGMPSVEIDVYETFDEYLDANDYQVGDSLYASTHGFVTNVAPYDGSPVIGICTKAPTLTSPALGIDLRI